MDQRRAQGDETNTSNPASVPIQSIAHNPRSLRNSYGDVAGLAESIRQVGVLVPLGVIRYELFVSHFPEHESEVVPSDWVVITGTRRLVAARLAELREVPVHVLDRFGRDELDEIVLADNIWSPLSPLEEAETLQFLVQRHGSTRKVAKRIGKSPVFVAQRLALLRLPDTLQQAVEDRTLTVEGASSIATLPVEEQQRIADAGPPYEDWCRSELDDCP